MLDATLLYSTARCFLLRSARCGTASLGWLILSTLYLIFYKSIIQMFWLVALTENARHEADSGKGRHLPQTHNWSRAEPIANQYEKKKVAFEGRSQHVSIMRWILFFHFCDSLFPSLSTSTLSSSNDLWIWRQRHSHAVPASSYPCFYAPSLFSTLGNTTSDFCCIDIELSFQAFPPMTIVPKITDSLRSTTLI